MKLRNTRGALSVVICCGIGALVFIGASFIGFNLLLGGHREAQNATDAGTLNVAKDAISAVGVPLQGQVEKDNFGYLADEKGNINLLAYNRVAAQAVMVALNCQAESSTQEAIESANRVMQAADDIGKRLSAKLTPDGNTVLDGAFLDCAGKNSVRMLGKTAKLDGIINGVSYLDQGDPGSVYISEQIYPHDQDGKIVALPSSFVTVQGGKSYLKGYEGLTFPNLQHAVSCVPVQPGCQPHLVCLHEFSACTNPPQLAKCTQAPANAYQVEAKVCNVTTTAAAQIGALDQTSQGNFSKGYITICNQPGRTFNGCIASPSDIFNFELMTGIFCGPADSSGHCAYTTNPNQYQCWLNYNTGKSSTKPTSAGVYGNASTITQPAFLATWQEMDCQLVQTMLPEWKQVYNRPDSSISQTCLEMMAVELFKALVMQGRSHLDSHGCALVVAPDTVTGLKAFDHNKPYPAYSPGAYPINFAQPGSAYALLRQCDGDKGAGGKVLDQLTWKAQQIQPSITKEQVTALLKQQTLNLGQKAYLYAGGSGQLTISTQAPIWVSAAALSKAPDGTAIKSQCTYDLGFQSVCTAATLDGKEHDYGNQDGWISTSQADRADGGYHFAMFTNCPPCQATDTAAFTPGSGAENNLGTLCFSNQTTGGGTFSAPN